MTDTTAPQKPKPKPIPPDKFCNARTRGGTPCRRPAGWGTDHAGTGRCKLHAGCSPGGPVGNKKAQTHALTSHEFKGYFREAKKAALEAIRRADAATDPLKAADVAGVLQADARRIMAGALMVEKRIADLEAEGKLTEKAQDRADELIQGYERLLTKVRACQTALLNHFGVGGDETQEITVHLATPPGVKTVNFMAGIQAELPEAQTPALPEPEGEVVEVEGGSVER